jgi:hypothetical protein
MDAHHPGLREMFTRESLMGSDWYHARLEARQSADRRLWCRHIEYLEQALSRDAHDTPGLRPELDRRRDVARRELEWVTSGGYLDSLVGTLGLDPALLPRSS